MSSLLIIKLLNYKHKQCICNRSCSKKLEELEGEKKKSKEEKKKKKVKSKKITIKVTNSDEIIEPVSKLKTIKKKGKCVYISIFIQNMKKYLMLMIIFLFFFFRLKHAKSENSTLTNNTSFTDVPRNSQPIIQNRVAQSTFRKSAFVATAIQTKKSSRKPIPNVITDNSDSDESLRNTKKVKKKSKLVKNKLQKTHTETKNRN